MGNILKRKEYAYTTDALGDAVNEIAYNYSNDGKTSWNKLLTSVDLDGDDAPDANESITYDAIGNPITYLGANLGWFGRQLQTYQKGDLNVSYTYDADGLRASKTVVEETLTGNLTYNYTYQYVGDKLYYLCAKEDGTTSYEMYFFYDSYGKLTVLKYFLHTVEDEKTVVKDYTYYVATNYFGDVVGLYAGEGSIRASYEYDAWGNLIAVYDKDGNLNEDLNSLAHRNPIRYRSYYYDTETGLYYLQSRYYNPEICRFLNADNQMSGVGGVPLGHNVFAYCYNSPVNMSDPTGHWPKWLVGALNVVSGFAQMSLGAALGATVGWTGVGAVAAGLLFVNGAATATQGVGQIVNHVTKSKVLSEDNIVRTGVQSVGNAIAGESGANAAGLLYDSAVMVADIYAGSVTRNIISCCFIAGTIVLTASGNKNIEKIKVGDLVWSENPETNEKALKQVVQTFVRESYELVHVFVNNEKIVTTPEHPFYVAKKGWVESIQLRAGDILVLQNGEYVIVEKIQHEILEKSITVYNFEVEDFHTYYVGNNAVLVHNACSGFSPNQQAVIDLARNNRNGLRKDEANILVDWAEEYGIKSHRPMVHPNRSGYWSNTEHVKVFNEHIPIIE